MNLRLFEKRNPLVENGKYYETSILLSSGLDKVLENNCYKTYERGVSEDECFSKHTPKTLKTPKLKCHLDNKLYSEEINLSKPLEECRFLRDQINLSSISISSNFEEKLSEGTDQSEKAKRIEKLISKEMRESYIFNNFKKLKFNADLIIAHKLTNGEIYLGSNSYKYNVDNLYNFDVIINVIGEDPLKTFTDKRLKFIKTSKKQNCPVEEITGVLDNSHFICFYVKKNENFNDYHSLADTIQKHLLQGYKILVHCKEGLLRSATLLTFYLRKYVFNKVEDANEFISLKRENASCIKFFFPTIEKILL